MKLKILCLILMVLWVCSCSKETKEDNYVIPVNYTGEASMKVYTENSENTYDLNIISRDNNYSFKTNTGDIAWNAAYFSDNRCVLNNDKFPENSVTIDNFELIDSLVYDFDLSKFDRVDSLPDELVYFDGNYKHVLNFSEETLLPEKIYIYKNENLVKTIYYEEINVE